MISHNCCFYFLFLNNRFYWINCMSNYICLFNVVMTTLPPLSRLFYTQSKNVFEQWPTSCFTYYYFTLTSCLFIVHIGFDGICLSWSSSLVDSRQIARATINVKYNWKNNKYFKKRWSKLIIRVKIFNNKYYYKLFS